MLRCNTLLYQTIAIRVYVMAVALIQNECVREHVHSTNTHLHQLVQTRRQSQLEAHTCLTSMTVGLMGTTEGHIRNFWRRNYWVSSCTSDTLRPNDDRHAQQVTCPIVATRSNVKHDMFGKGRMLIMRCAVAWNVAATPSLLSETGGVAASGRSCSGGPQTEGRTPQYSQAHRCYATRRGGSAAGDLGA